MGTELEVYGVEHINIQSSQYASLPYLLSVKLYK